jgi:tetratricopeptide (TPR) repeat protein
MKQVLLSSGLIVALAGSMAFAAGSDDSTPPKPTKTTTECKGGKIFDDKVGKCVNPVQGMYDDDTLYGAARELAYAGQYENAIGILKLAADQNDPRILNYLGFTHRKSGDLEAGMAYYIQALEIDPDYNLARSYMGQAMVESGNFDGAKEQLVEIRDRGGRDTWAYASLKQAISTKSGY